MIELDPVLTPMKYMVGSAAGSSCGAIRRDPSNEISSLPPVRRIFFYDVPLGRYHRGVRRSASPEPVDLRQQISAKLPYLSPALRQLGEFILATPDAPQSMTISELARAVGVADSSVSRFTCPSSGSAATRRSRSGWPSPSSRGERRTGPRPEGFVYENVTRGDSVATILAKLSGSSRHALDETARQLDVEALAEAVGLVERARTLVIASMGSSSLAAENAVGRFTRAGKKCLFERDQALQVMTREERRSRRTS